MIINTKIRGGNAIWSFRMGFSPKTDHRMKNKTLDFKSMKQIKICKTNVASSNASTVVLKKVTICTHINTHSKQIVVDRRTQNKTVL